MAFDANATLRPGNPVSGLSSGVDGGCFDGKRRLHDEVEGSIGLNEKGEILIFAFAGGIAAGLGYIEDSLGVFEESIPKPGFHANDLSADCAVFRAAGKKFFREKREPLAASDRLIDMTASRMQPSHALRNAYRETFEDYADKLKTLQRLMNDRSVLENQIEAAQCDVENARAAHSCARDRLAKELMRRTAQAGAPDEKSIRNTARLIWEFAGRPEGTAERDWREAERLSQAASAC